MQNKDLTSVIIDDDRASTDILLRDLSRRAGVHVAGTADNLADGTLLVARTQPDIIFLDMAFPDSNGLDWFGQAQLPAHTRTVFYTCYQRYVHDALALQVFDFLLKPFDPSELDLILHRYRTLPQSEQTRQAPPMPKDPATRPLAITTVTNAKLIANPSEIIYFRYDSDRKLWECVFSNLRRYILKRQTTAESILGYGTDFVRTHKRFIVNVRYVGMISGEDCVLLPPFDAIDEIKITKSYRRDLMDRFYDI